VSGSTRTRTGTWPRCATRCSRSSRGFDPDHPLIDDLKRLSFTAGVRFSERQACAAEFPARFVSACRGVAPLLRFLARAIGLSF